MGHVLRMTGGSLSENITEMDTRGNRSRGILKKKKKRHLEIATNGKYDITSLY